MYGSETWTTTKVDESSNLIFEQKDLRRIFETVCDKS